MEDEDEMPQSSVNFIPCLYFLKKAVAKEKPDKVRVYFTSFCGKGLQSEFSSF